MMDSDAGQGAQAGTTDQKDVPPDGREVQSNLGPAKDVQQPMPQVPARPASSSSLLTGWIRRGTRVAVVAEADQPGTPAWSEASDNASTSGSVPDTDAGDSAAPAAVPAASPAGDASNFRQALPAKAAAALGSRLGNLGGWITAAGQALRGGPKARMAGSPQLQDARAGRLRLEQLAAGVVPGPARLALLRQWCMVLAELAPAARQAGRGGAPQPGSPASPCTPEGDWQQLLPFDIAAAPSEADLGWRANEVLFIDTDAPDNPPYTFRELFLRSCALETLVAGFVEAPPADEGERAVLGQLLRCCLLGDGVLAGRLVQAISAVGRALAQARAAGVQPPDCAAMKDTISDAIGALKAHAEVECLDRRMAALREDIAARAADAAQRHNFHSGAQEPTADSSPHKLASGLTATAQVMEAAGHLRQLAAQRARLLAGASPMAFADVLDTLSAKATQLAGSVAGLEVQIQQAQAQQADSRDFRGRKLAGMEVALAAQRAEVEQLEAAAAQLAAQLAAVQEQLARARARKADMEEGRNVFEEGNTFTLDALQHQVEQCTAAHRRQLAEAAAVSDCQELLHTAMKGHEKGRADAIAAAQLVEREAAVEHMHAATRHCYYQRAELQLLLRQLRFCTAELKSLAERQGSMAEMGMDTLAADMAAARERLLAKYGEAQAAAQARLAAVAALRAQLACGDCQPAQRSQEVGAGAGDTAADTTASVTTTSSGPAAGSVHSVPEQPRADSSSEAAEHASTGPQPDAAGSVATPAADSRAAAAGGWAAETQLARELDELTLAAQPPTLKPVQVVAPALPSQAGGAAAGGAAMSQELRDLFASIAALADELAALPCPDGAQPAAPAPALQPQVQPENDSDVATIDASSGSATAAEAVAPSPNTEGPAVIHEVFGPDHHAESGA